MNIKNEIKYIKRATRFYVYTGKTIRSVYKMENLMKSLSFNQKEKDGVFEELLRNWGIQTLQNLKIEVTIDDSLLVEKDNVIFMVNHNSNIDTLVLLATSPKSIRFIAKKSLFKIPLLGKAMSHVGMFEIDRRNNKDAIDTLSFVAKKLKYGNNSIVNFPEGTRNRGDKLQEFKKGGFHLAIESQKKIVPVTILNTKKINSIKDWRIKDGLIKVFYGKAIETKGLTKKDIPELMIKTREIIESKLDA